jgi:SAM-dependent methyltransferase
MPEEVVIARAYQAEYVAAKHTDEFSNPEWWEHVSRPYRDSILATLADHGVRGTVVDCGCGWGHLVEGLQRRGFDARGVDLSRDETAYAERKGLPVQRGTLKDLRDLEGRVDAVTMLGVFEHLLDHEDVLADVGRLLRDGGLFVTLHPTAAFFRLLGTALRLGRRGLELPELHGTFAPPWHTVLFSIAGTQKVAERCGFEMVDLRPAPQGRLPGPNGVMQRVLEGVNKLGWASLGARWPLVTTHVFAFRKAGSLPKPG